MKKFFLIALTMLCGVLFEARAQYAYAPAAGYRPLGDNEAVLLTQADVDALDEAGVIDWSEGELALSGTRLAQVRTVQNKKGKDVEKKFKLTKEEQAAILENVNGIDFNPLWKKSAILQNTGMYMLIGGGLFMIGGAAAGGGLILVGVIGLPIVVALVAVFSFGQADMTEVLENFWDGLWDKAKIGGSIALAGSAVAITGAVLLAVGHKNLKRTVNYTNALGKPQQAAFNFGATPHGVGLTFNF